MKNIFENQYLPLMDGGYCVVSLSGIQLIDFEIGSPGLGGDKASDSQFELHENFIDEDSNEYNISIFNSYNELFVSIDLDSNDDVFVEKLKKLISIEIVVKSPYFSDDEETWNSSFGIYSPPVKAPKFFAIRLSHQNDIKTLKQYYEDKDYTTYFVIDGLTHHKDSIKTNDLVFLAASGWRDSMSFSYTQGLYGIARVTSLPYNQNAKSYTIDVQFIFFFDKILTKQDFLNYPKTADIPYIGPSTKGTKTQAISTISIEDAKEVLVCAQKITKTEINIFNKYFPWFFNNTFDVSEKKFIKMTDNHLPALEVTAIANVFAEFIKNYSHEDSATMMGIFGRWGRGKTFFYREVKKAMFNHHSAKEKYYFCEFQPWKYQEKESAWAYLYQTILNKFLNNNTKWCCGFSCKWAKLAVLNLKKMSLSKTLTFFGFITLLYFAVDTLPAIKVGINEVIPDYIKKVGVAGIFFYLLYKIFIDHQETAKSIVNQYTKNHYFSNKLGFQNEIQEELKILLKTFISENEKLIIFIDDLDRCSEHMLIDIIDSLKLMLDDQEIRKRIIILTALDERILLKSIEHKYPYANDNEETVSSSEYIEKFFLMGIKLDELDKNDIGKLVDSYVKKVNELDLEITLNQENNEEKIKANQVTEKNEAVEVKKERTNNVHTENIISKTQKVETSSREIYIMDKDEQEYFKKQMQEVENATPRKINMFLHRYLFFKALAFELLNKKILYSIDPKLYIDLIFLISQKNADYKTIMKNTYQADTQSVNIEIYNNKYNLHVSEAISLLKIAEMVSPF